MRVFIWRLSKQITLFYYNYIHLTKYDYDFLWHVYHIDVSALRIQVCPKNGIGPPTFLFFSDGIGTLNPIRSGGVVRILRAEKYVSKKLPTDPWNRPQTLNYLFMKEILNHICISGYLGSVEIFLECNYLEVSRLFWWSVFNMSPSQDASTAHSSRKSGRTILALLGDGSKQRPVVSNIFYFHPCLGKWSNLTNIFQMDWNHQLVKD